jgi:energy-coupling factor transporter ATP-binding protein EcfA2
MLLKDRPLLQDRIDAPAFLARPRLEEPLIRALEQGRNALLVGAWGSGKTTLLRRVQARLIKNGQRTLWINAGLAGDVNGLLDQIDEEMRRLDDDEGLEEAPEPGEGLLGSTRILSAHPSTAIILDGLRDEEVGFDLFGRIRDELWAAGHVWLVAVTPQDSSRLRTPPADAFWAIVVEIPPLGPAEAQELLQKGLSPEEREKVRPNSPIAGVHPRELIREVGRILEGGGDESPPIGALTEEAAKIGRSEAMTMTELIGLGRPASAGDEELLNRLGWSRAYTQRILSTLEAAHLVHSIPETNQERSGRPRKLYVPNLRALR